MNRVQFLIDEGVAALLDDTPAQIERNVLEMLVLDLYRQRKLAIGRSARRLGMDRAGE